MIDLAVAGEDAESAVAEIGRREQAIIDGLVAEGLDAAELQRVLDARQERLRKRLAGISLLENCPDESRAEILASGENLSSRLMAEVLRLQQIDARWSDSDVLPPANDSWLDSLIDIDAARDALQARLAEGARVLVLPGFHGRNAAGAYQLMGRNGSDYSAAAVAAAINARSCQIDRHREHVR